VRHGEGYHNIGFESLEDTHLTANGWSQAAKLQKHINHLKKPLDLDVRLETPQASSGCRFASEALLF
jgi:broad specificity phosphatase PhoE